MKTNLQILICITILSILPISAAENESKPQSVEERLREIDLSIILKQYEQVKSEEMKMRLQLALIDYEEGITKEDQDTRRTMLEKRLAAFVHRADDLRAMALKLGEKTVVKTK